MTDLTSEHIASINARVRTATNDQLVMMLQGITKLNEDLSFRMTARDYISQAWGDGKSPLSIRNMMKVAALLQVLIPQELAARSTVSVTVQ